MDARSDLQQLDEFNKLTAEQQDEIVGKAEAFFKMSKEEQKAEIVKALDDLRDTVQKIQAENEHLKKVIIAAGVKTGEWLTGCCPDCQAKILADIEKTGCATVERVPVYQYPGSQMVN